MIFLLDILPTVWLNERNVFPAEVFWLINFFDEPHCVQVENLDVLLSVNGLWNGKTLLVNDDIITNKLAIFKYKYPSWCCKKMIVESDLFLTSSMMLQEDDYGRGQRQWILRIYEALR